MRIGSRTLRNNLFVAPMAGVTDRPFRQLCKKFGAGLAVSEMVASNSLLWGSEKTRRRADHEGEVEPISVQIAGADPVMMAEAARFNVERGAQIVDINMGCPAKKVCNTLAGSALLKDEPLVGHILKAVVKAVNVPVTLKFRTGWDQGNKNALKVAKIAEDSGVQLLSLHGRTRACGFSGRAEYDTIREVKRSTSLPVVANGDITTPEEAKHVLEYTGADGIMIDFAEDPGPPLSRATDHDPVGARVLEHVLRFLGSSDVAVCHHGQARRPFDFADRVVLGPAREAAGAGAAVQGQQLHAAVFGDPRDLQSVLVVQVPPRAELQRDGYIHRTHYGLENAPDQGLILEKRGPGQGVADFLCRAAHVDIHDLRAPLHVEARGLGHHDRVGPGDLHRDWLDFAFVIRAAARFLATPQQRVRGDHIGYGEARTELIAQLPGGAIIDPGIYCGQ